MNKVKGLTRIYKRKAVNWKKLKFPKMDQLPPIVIEVPKPRKPRKFTPVTLPRFNLDDPKKCGEHLKKNQLARVAGYEEFLNGLVFHKPYKCPLKKSMCRKTRTLSLAGTEYMCPHLIDEVVAFDKTKELKRNGRQLSILCSWPKKAERKVKIKEIVPVTRYTIALGKV